MAHIRSIKHSKSKLAGYIKQAKKFFHGKFQLLGLDASNSRWGHLSITGALDRDRKFEINAKANEPREIAKAPIDTISEPMAVTTITSAHVGDTEVVPNEGYDYDYWAWNELPPTPSEPKSASKPSTASAPELKGQEPTVDNGDNILLEIASIGNSITRILQSASDSSSTLTTPTSVLSPISASASVLALIPTTTTIDSPPHHLSPSSSSFPVTSSYFSSAPPKRFQRSPFFGKRIGVTPRVSRIHSVSGAFDPGTAAFESPTGPTLVAGSKNESEGQSEDEGRTLIEPQEGGFETFGAEKGGRPFMAILAELRQVLRLPPSPGVPAVLAPGAITPPPLSDEERYQRAFAMIRELRGILELS